MTIVRNIDTPTDRRNCIKAIKELGMAVKYDGEEFRVNFKHGREATAYYTTDAHDALETARAMARRAAQ